MLPLGTAFLDNSGIFHCGILICPKHQVVLLKVIYLALVWRWYVCVCVCVYSYVYVFDVCICMQMHMCTPEWICMETKGQHWVLLHEEPSNLVLWVRAHGVGYTDWPASTRGPSVLLPQCWDNDISQYLDFFMWVHEIKHRSSNLRSEPFSHWAVTPYFPMS